MKTAKKAVFFFIRPQFFQNPHLNTIYKLVKMQALTLYYHYYSTHYLAQLFVWQQFLIYINEN